LSASKPLCKQKYFGYLLVSTPALPGMVSDYIRGRCAPGESVCHCVATQL